MVAVKECKIITYTILSKRELDGRGGWTWPGEVSIIEIPHSVSMGK